MIRRVASISTVVLAAAWAASPAGAVVNGAQIPCADRRFDAVGLLFSNWGGLDCGGSHVSGSCVLIDPTHVVTARHCVFDGNQTPPEILKIRFRRSTALTINNHWGNNASPGDCNSQYIEVGVVSYQYLAGPCPLECKEEGGWDGTADLAVLELDTAITHIRPIPVGPRPPELTSAYTIAGWGYDGACLGIGDIWTLRYDSGIYYRNGPNLCPGVNGNFIFGYGTGEPCSPACDPTTSACLLMHSDAGHLAMPNVFDSGGAFLYRVPCGSGGGSELRLAGVIVTTGSNNAGIALARQFNWCDPVIVTRKGFPVPDRYLIPMAGSGASCTLCRLDVNADGVVNEDDMVSYVNAWFAGLCLADFDNDGSITTADLNAYFALFFSSSCD